MQFLKLSLKYLLLRMYSTGPKITTMYRGISGLCLFLTVEDKACLV